MFLTLRAGQLFEEGRGLACAMQDVSSRRGFSPLGASSVLLHAKTRIICRHGQMSPRRVLHAFPSPEKAALLWFITWHTFVSISSALFRDRQSHSACRSSLRTQSVGKCIGQQSSFFRVRPCLCGSSSRNLGLENVMKPNLINGTLKQGPAAVSPLCWSKRGGLCRVFLALVRCFS